MLTKHNHKLSCGWLESKETSTSACRRLGMAMVKNASDCNCKTQYANKYQSIYVSKWQHTFALQLYSYYINPALVHSFNRIQLKFWHQRGAQLQGYINIMQSDFVKYICGLAYQLMTLPGHAVKSVMHVTTATQFSLIAYFVNKFSIISIFSRVGIYHLQENLA